MARSWRASGLQPSRPIAARRSTDGWPVLPRGGPDSIAAVIRFEPSVSAWWARVDDRQAEAAFGERIAAVLAVLDNANVPVTEIQLDYDSPNRLLPRYAKVLSWLTRNTLAGRRVWVTSLVTHLRDPDYLGSLRGVVDGHILQLFDTGDRATPEKLAEIVRRLEVTDLPFRIGLGAFERALDSGPTDHRVWIRSLPALRALPGYRGWWIFPAGESYYQLVKQHR